MATLRDEEEQKGSGLNQALGQQPQAQQAQPQEQQAPMEGTGQAQIGASQGAKAPQAPAQKQQKAGTGTFANLKSYLQAAQGGGRVAQAATQRVQNVATQAQKGIQQAQKAFGTKMEAGSLQGMGTAAEEAKGIIGAARGVTYQAPQPAPAEPTRGGSTNRNEEYLKSILGDRYTDLQKDLQDASMSIGTADMRYNPVTGSYGSSSRAGQVNDVYEKYGIDVTKLPSYTPFDQYKAPEGGILRKGEVVPEPTIPTPAPTQPQAPAQPQQYFTPEQQQRFAEIINAQYQGPESLQQAGLYEQAARKAQTAQQALQQAQTAGGREQLLRDIFGRSRDYSRGQSKLDALLLNTSQQGVQSLQEQAQKAGNVQQQLQEAQNLSANEAARRAEAIQGIASGARTAFTTARTAEETAANERIKAIQDNWNKLPEYFKEALKSGKQLSQQEADLLGITAGTGLYNLSPEDIVQTNAAEANRLISKNELSRQLALQQLSALDTSKQLQKDLLYTDLEKAGTQTAADAINKQAIKDLLVGEENKFKETAAQQDVVGYGKKKHKTTGKYYYADETANLKDVLERAGYDFNAPGNQQMGNIDASGNVSFDKDPNAMFETNVSGTGVLQGIANVLSPGIGLGDVVGGLFGGGSSSKYAKSTAARLANEDLQRNLEKALQDAGFYNRTAVGETEETKARQAALADILALQEKYRG